MACRAQADGAPPSWRQRLEGVRSDLELLQLLSSAVKDLPESHELWEARAELIASIKRQLEQLGGDRRHGRP